VVRAGKEEEEEEEEEERERRDHRQVRDKEREEREENHKNRIRGPSFAPLHFDTNERNPFLERTVGAAS
jgi:hypothetical protein